MLIESKSQYYLKKVRAKAKMWEYHIPENLHTAVEKEVEDLLVLSIAIIGDFSDKIINNPSLSQSDYEDDINQLRFVAKFFDSYVESGLFGENRDYYLLLGSVVCYMCGMNGSSLVLAKNISDNIDLEAGMLDSILCQLLRCKDEIVVQNCSNQIRTIVDIANKLIKTGIITDLSPVIEFRKIIYRDGTDRELLFIDCLLAVLFIKQGNSAYYLLPKFTGIGYSIWNDVLNQGTLVKELWPAQRVLGLNGVYSGKSATIQLPTGAGKTKSMALIILSAFLGGRTNLAIVVAPFRALCREISDDLSNAFSYNPKIRVNELSDSLQMDFDDPFEIEEKEINKVFISTPEKLLYILRQDISVLTNVGLLIFDEGHLFDDYERGITYELLVSTIKHYSSKQAQKILISAVIPNADQINNWLTDGTGVVIKGSAIQASEKAVAITEIARDRKTNKQAGFLFFVNPTNPDEDEFYVPRVVSPILLQKKPRERKEKFFPEINDSNYKNDFAIAYTLQLSENGGIAIFCGRKDSVEKILSRCLEVESRGINLSPILDQCDKGEIEKLKYQISQNFGVDNIYTNASEKGLFAHHSGLPAGIRTAEEYAMQQGLIQFIICTSTLAQGVNLPIRYLIISNIYQGKERIRVRDFQNLIGRAGRSGMYTEGTIILTELNVYKNKRDPYKNWKWLSYKELLSSDQSEACISSLLGWLRTEPENKECLDKIIQTFETSYQQGKFNDEAQKLLNSLEDCHVEWAKKTISLMVHNIEAIESFLLFYLVEKTYEESKDEIHRIVSETLAFYLSTNIEKEKIIHIIDLIGHFLVTKVDTPDKRYRYSKSLLGVKREIEIDLWIESNLSDFIVCKDMEQMLCVIFPQLLHTNNKVVNACSVKKELLDLALMWIRGKSYHDIYRYAKDTLHLLILKRKKFNPIELTDIVALCDSFFSYDCTLTLSAITEGLGYHTDQKDILDQIHKLSKAMKYGLKEKNEIVLYELGFNDRSIAQGLYEIIKDSGIAVGKKAIIAAVSGDVLLWDKVRTFIKQYPKYYEDKAIELFI